MSDALPPFTPEQEDRIRLIALQEQVRFERTTLVMLEQTLAHYRSINKRGGAIIGLDAEERA